MTPTSGDAPYLYEAQFNNAHLLNGTDFELLFRERTVVGSCPSFGNVGAERPQAASDLLQNGEYTDPSGTVPVGSCRASSLVIIHVPSGDVVEFEGVHIDNV